MSDINPEKMKVAELRDALEARGLDTKGTKPFLVERLKEALLTEGGGDPSFVEEEEEEEETGVEGQDNIQEEDMDQDDDQEEEVEYEQQEPEPAQPAQVKVNGNGAAPPAVVEEEVQAVQANGVKEKESPASQTEEEGKGVKRKLEEEEELKPWIVREDEPEIPDNFLCLDWYNSDLNLRIKNDDFLTALPMNRDSWSWCYAGVRATHGFTSGKLYFEVKLTETLKVWTDRDGFHFDVRVGWSTKDATMMLGEDDLSWGYSGNNGKKVHSKTWEEYGECFAKGDVIGAFLDISDTTVTMSFSKNGSVMENQGFQFPLAELNGEALYPHILSRNTKFECNFGKNKAGEETKPFKDLPESMEGFTQIALVPEEERVRGYPRIPVREECEMLLMVGLPSSGKTTWAKNYAAEHPAKRYDIINAAIYLEKATVNGESRKEHTQVAWDKVHHRLTKSLQDVIKVASSRRRNIILDQTNVYSDAQLRKARPFERMIRKCIVVVPSDEEWLRRRAKQEEEGEKNIPDDAVNEMKANLAMPSVNTKVFSEIIFPELGREEAQAVVDEYNKDAKEKGFGKRHEEYKSKWEANKRMRGGPIGLRGGRGFPAPMFGRGGRGFGGYGMRGGMGMGHPMGGGMGMPMRGGGMGGGAWGAWGGGMAPYGSGYGGAPPFGQGYGWGAGGGGGYPGRKNWGGWGR